MIQAPNTKPDRETKKLKGLIARFANKNGLLRRRARARVERAGRAATPFLIDALSDPSARVRWEAAKTLVHLKDPAAAQALAKALADKAFEVRWLAAEALIALRSDAIVAVLKALERRPRSWALRQGAHHVLHAFEREELLDPKTLRVLDELRHIEPEAEALGAIRDALQTATKGRQDER